MVLSSVLDSGRRPLGWVLFVATATVLTACAPTSGASSGAAGSPAPHITATSPSPLTPAVTARQEAIESYVGMWHDMAAAATTSDWRSPRIGAHATGDALLVISKSLYTDHLNNVVTKGEPKNEPTVSSMNPPEDPTTVLISDCGDDSGWLKYRTDGRLLNDAPGGRRAITAEVKKQPDGSWKVSRFAVEAVGSCT
ncbi:MAG: hypothetical protein ACRDQ1_06030 [Sciscionella sp.]